MRKMPDILLWYTPAHTCPNNTHTLIHASARLSVLFLGYMLLGDSSRSSPSGQLRGQTLCHSPALQKPYLPRPGQLLDEPLTRMNGENPQQALEINRVVSDTLGVIGMAA